MSNFLEKVKVVLGAAPTWGAAAAAALTWVIAEAVPRLPDNVGVKVAAVAAAVLAAVTAVVKVVSRVTPVLFPEDRGLLPPEPVEGEANDFWGDH